jgi:hypothetical protein
VTASGGATIGVGYEYLGAVEVVGFGNDAGDVCVNSEQAEVMLAPTAAALPTVRPPSAPTTAIACVSQVRAPCGNGCCRGLMCAASASDDDNDGGVCVLDTRLNAPPPPPTTSIGSNDEGTNTEPPVTSSSSSSQVSSSRIYTILSFTAGITLIVLGGGVVVLILRRYRQTLYQDFDMSSVKSSEQHQGSRLHADGGTQCLPTPPSPTPTHPPTPTHTHTHTHTHLAHFTSCLPPIQAHRSTRRDGKR